MQRVKLVDVAKAAGVHPGTASRALNPATQDKVSPDTLRRVTKMAEKLGYVPNTLARGLRTQQSYVVGMVVPDITNPLFPPMIRAAEQVLSQAGYTLVLTDTDNDANTERHQLEQLRARGADGFLIATARWDDALLEEIADQGVPAVLVNRNTGSHRIPYVGGDERAGVQVAVAHLHELGHTRIAYLAGPHDTSTGRERASAFRQAVRTLGIPSSHTSVRQCSAYTEAAGAATTQRLLDSGADVTAILCGNDLIALGALGVIADAGLTVPDDLSIIGFNDMSIVDRLTPPLTTVRLPLHRIGELGARILLEQLDSTGSNYGAIQTLLDVSLMVRGTTAAPR
jgi:LacI family transcriptional regulator